MRPRNALGLRQQCGREAVLPPGDDLLQAEQGADGAFDGRLVHQDDAGDVLFHNRRSELARRFHRDFVGERLLRANQCLAG